MSFAHFGRFATDLVGRVRVLGWTSGSPALPYITARSADDELLGRLRGALAGAAGDPALAGVRARLLIGGLDFDPDPAFTVARGHEQRAIGLGYPNLQ